MNINIFKDLINSFGLIEKLNGTFYLDNYRGYICSFKDSSRYFCIWEPQIFDGEICFTTCVFHKRIDWCDYEDIKKGIEKSIRMAKELQKELRKKLIEEL